MPESVLRSSQNQPEWDANISISVEPFSTASLGMISNPNSLADQAIQTIIQRGTLEVAHLFDEWAKDRNFFVADPEDLPKPVSSELARYNMPELVDLFNELVKNILTDIRVDYERALTNFLIASDFTIEAEMPSIVTNLLGAKWCQGVMDAEFPANFPNSRMMNLWRQYLGLRLESFELYLSIQLQVADIEFKTSSIIQKLCLVPEYGWEGNPISRGQNISGITTNAFRYEVFRLAERSEFYFFNNFKDWAAAKQAKCYELVAGVIEGLTAEQKVHENYEESLTTSAKVFFELTAERFEQLTLDNLNALNENCVEPLTIADVFGKTAEELLALNASVFVKLLKEALKTFDNDVAIMMDFSVPAQGDLQFIYRPEQLDIIYSHASLRDILSNLTDHEGYLKDGLLDELLDDSSYKTNVIIHELVKEAASQRKIDLAKLSDNDFKNIHVKIINPIKDLRDQSKILCSVRFPNERMPVMLDVWRDQRTGVLRVDKHR